jgi:pimeloyl-ACP methyl ester carboxylesterase
MDHVSDRYRTYALDFWGFGESDRSHEAPSIAMYTKMLRSFMDDMGIRKANLVGHGMGGMVAACIARDHPERFLRLMLVSTPLQGSLLSSVTKRGTFAWLLGPSTPTAIWGKLVRQIPIDDPDVQQELYEDTDSLSEKVVNSVQRSILNTDLRPVLKELSDDIPVLIAYGEKDPIVPPDHAAEFMNLNPNRPHQLIVLPGANHFPFLEQRNTFSRVLMDFLVSQGSPVEIKEQWRRRVSQREYL